MPRRLLVLADAFAIARLEASAPIPAWALRGQVSSITRTPDELSIVCLAASVPDDVQVERPWRGLRVAGPLDFALTGVLSSLANPLAAAGISLFALSTYDTDYILVREHDLRSAITALKAAGHDVVSS